MAVGFRGGGPKIFIGTGNPVAGTLTGAWQPQAGDLLAVFNGNDYYAITAMGTVTANGSNMTAVTNGSANAGSPDAHVKLWLIDVASTGDVAISVTESAPADEDKGLFCWVLTGAAPVASQPDGGSSGAAGSASAGSAQSSFVFTGVTPSSAAAWLLYHMNSGGGSSAGPPFGTPSGMTQAYSAATGGISYTGGYQQLSASGATGTRTVTSGAGSITWAGVMVAIAAASGGTQNGTVTFGAAPTLTVSGTVAQPATVSFGAAPQLSASGTIVKLATVSFGAAPILSASAGAILPATVSFGAAPLLTASGTIEKLATVSFAAAPVLAAAAVRQAFGSAAFGAAPLLTVGGFVVAQASITFAAAPRLVASGSTGPVVAYATAVLTPGALAAAALTPGWSAATLTPGALGAATLTPGNL